MDNNRTVVRIAGMEFKLTGDESQQYMDSLAEMVNAKVEHTYERDSHAQGGVK